MVINSGAFREVVNGYEKRTNGLWVHTGSLVVKGGPVVLPASERAVPGAATDAASAVVLVNELRSVLIEQGWCR